MTQKEYEQKKAECWEEASRRYDISLTNGIIHSAFNYAFDRAYVLGKQEKDAEGEEMLTCDRDVVRMLYDRTDSVKVRQMLESLFGYRCLPDESNLSESLTGSEPKPSEPTESGTHSFDNILKDSFRGHNRLHIAAMITASIYSSDTIAKQFNSIEAIVRKSLDIADTLIAEAEKGGDK